MRRMVRPDGRKPRSRRVTSWLLKALSKKAVPAPANWPMTVAMAAPAASMRGTPNSPKMNTGSSTMLVSAPTIWVIIA